MKPVCARAPIFAKSHKTGGPLPGQKGPDSTALIVPNCPSYFFRRRFAPLRVPLTTRPSPHFHTHPGEVPPAAKRVPGACFRGRGRPHLHSKPVCAKSPFFAKSHKTGVQLPVRQRPDPGLLIVPNMTHYFFMYRFAPPPGHSHDPSVNPISHPPKQG